MSHGRHAAKPGVDAIKVIADDLNQPLFAITANTDAISRMLAREAPDLVEVRAALADITSDAQRVSRMIGTLQRLLAAAREPPADIDVRELVDECVVEMRTEMFAQRVCCDVQTAPHLPGIRGIRRQLVQMLVNLVTNSLEAMSSVPARERRLALRALLHDPRTIEISVEDSGVGIAPEDAPRVFDPYFTTKPHRSGLGLAICRNIIDAHGGDISVTRATGCGAAVRVLLPASS